MKKEAHPLKWEVNDKGQEALRSTLFDDPFFSSEGGEEECRHVFINGNDLPNRWKTIGKGQFFIAELGFGTGLNFLETWRQWQQGLKLRGEGQSLHFISFEGFPLPYEDFAKVHQNWTNLKDLSKNLSEKWLELKEGRNIWQMASDVTLELIVAPIEEGLDLMENKADAWYLDGFSPSKNSEMWSQTVMEKLYANSNEGATLATYSSAGWVRRNIEAAGFEAERVRGFGKKRHMLIGARNGSQ